MAANIENSLLLALQQEHFKIPIRISAAGRQAILVSGMSWNLRVEWPTNTKASTVLEPVKEGLGPLSLGPREPTF
ncbi:hypothetical protein VTK56DRAFT_1387 [Thermocarpiscus australiensis]